MALALLPLLHRPSSIELAADGPSLRGAWPAVAALVAVLAAAEYRANRVDGDGAFRLDVGEHVDTAVHVGVTWELVASYPPQVPGLAGVPMHYHVGTHLVRAAAARWAGIHPYDAISRFDVTLWGIALVLALRSAAHALGLGAAAVRLAGFVPLAADLSFVLGLAAPLPERGDEARRQLRRGRAVRELDLARDGGGAGGRRGSRRAPSGARGAATAILAAVLGAGVGFLKAFTAAQLLLAIGLAWLARRSRLALVPVGAVVALVVLVLALGSTAPPGGESVRVAFVPFAPTNPARIAFGLPEARGLGARALRPRAGSCCRSGCARSVFRPALRALRRRRRGSGQPRRAGAHGLAVRSRPQHHGRPRLRRELLLPPGERARALALRAARARRLLGGVAACAPRSCLLLTLPATAELVVRRARAQPERLPPPAVRAMDALRAASCPGDVVMTRPGCRARAAPVVVLAGRRVPLAGFIPYWRQFTTPGRVAAREAEVLSFFRAADAASAVEAARGLGASYVYFSGVAAEGAEPRPRSVRQLLLEAAVLEPVHVEPRAAVYRIRPLAGAPGCGGVAKSARTGP